MHEKDETTDDGGTAVSTRTMEIVVAVVFLVISALVIKDSLRVGAGWAEIEGPRAGYFPFYIGLMMGLASLVTLLRAVWAGVQERRANPTDAGGRRKAPGAGRVANEPFVSVQALRRVLLVLVPMLVYVLVVSFVGIYVASAAYVALFMIYLGNYRVVSAVATGLCVALALFLMFEVWFLVPLPKGPIEEFFGY
jgi:putative tricarboxylic transport membrane protein